MCLQPQKCLSNCYLCMCSFPYPLSLFHLFDVGLLLLLLNFTSTFFAALHLIGTKLFQHFFKRTPSQVLFESVCLCVDICGWVTSFLRERGWWEAKYTTSKWPLKTPPQNFYRIYTNLYDSSQMPNRNGSDFLNSFFSIFVFQVVRMAYKLCLGFRLYSRL